MSSTKMTAAVSQIAPFQFCTIWKSIDFLGKIIVFDFALSLYLSVFQRCFQLFDLAFERVVLILCTG